ncbi:SOUL family heme-binding protein [Natronorubrum halophilum]|uniref:SOUL family heme-binding protein n=1 Tax=Natronorubrum halophilum TaxID=1702106 RepID=UPI000EF6EF56|nr:heme-binding protein [Natronorubrum halophilum]
MRFVRKLLLGTAALVGLWIGWGVYVTRTTERVPLETLDRFDGIEIRRYPRTIRAETTAPDAATAFRRLFRYISGENTRREDVAMTTPVTVRGTSIPMTAPVRTESDGDEVMMAFYLPRTYTDETAPVPTDPAVRLVVDPPRTVAVRRFSWYATNERVDRERAHLLEELSRQDIERRGEPTLLQYNDPWTPPFMRTNEVEVELEAPPEQIRREDP